MPDDHLGLFRRRSGIAPGATRAGRNTVSLVPVNPGDAPSILAIDPLADLLFSLVAIVVLAIIIMLPVMGRSGAPAPPSMAESLAGSAMTLGGRAVEPFVARAAGLQIGHNPDLIPLDAIPQDEALAAKLRDMRARGEPVVLMIDPDGTEAAFLFEPVASLNGPPSMRTVRLDRTCTHARSERLAVACRMQAAAGGGLR
jgi:hypothetical protein